MEIEYHILRSNGEFSLVEEPFHFLQHKNEQNGLDLYVKVLNHKTGNINTIKLYRNNKGLYFKKNGTFYLDDFTKQFKYVPYQILEV